MADCSLRENVQLLREAADRLYRCSLTQAGEGARRGKILKLIDQLLESNGAGPYQLHLDELYAQVRGIEEGEGQPSS